MGGTTNYVPKWNSTADGFVTGSILDLGTLLTISNNVNITGTTTGSGAGLFSNGSYSSTAPTLQVGDSGYGLSSSGGILVHHQSGSGSMQARRAGTTYNIWDSGNLVGPFTTAGGTISGNVHITGGFYADYSAYCNVGLSVYDLFTVGQGSSSSANGYVQMQGATPRWYMRAFTSAGTGVTYGGSPINSIEISYTTGAVSFPCGIQFGSQGISSISGAGYTLLVSGTTNAPTPVVGQVLFVDAQSTGATSNQLGVPSGATWLIYYRTTAGARASISAGGAFDFYHQCGLLLGGADGNWHFIHV